MSAAERKIALAKKLLETNDKELIKKMEIIMDSHEKDWYDDLTVEQKAAIEEGIAQGEKGKVIPHEAVRKKYQKWLRK